MIEKSNQKCLIIKGAFCQLAYVLGIVETFQKKKTANYTVVTLCGHVATGIFSTAGWVKTQHIE